MSNKEIVDDQVSTRLLYLTAEAWPTFRTDIAVLFGKYLPINYVQCDLVTEQEPLSLSTPEIVWPAGEALLFKLPRHRAGQYLIKFWHQCRVLLTSDYKKYDAIQVRDMTVIALLAIVIARINKLSFFYWLSYPQSEGQIQRAQARGLKAGMRYWFPLLQGTVGKWLLYWLILPNADHIFVQSQQMQQDLANKGIPMQKMTPIPMGVDIEIAKPEKILPSDDPKLQGKRVIIYLGTLDRVRKIEILFEMLVIIRQQIPDILLVLAGDTEDSDHSAWLRQEATRLDVMRHVLWTGWLPMAEAWRYLRSAELGLSPFPRGYLLDMASPTKAIEYMAFGLPVVANDNPDQAEVLAESGAGLCVALTAESFAESTINLLNNSAQRMHMASLGKAYVNRVRGYEEIAASLARKYQLLIHIYTQKKLIKGD